MQRPPLTHIPAVLNGTPPDHPVEGIGGNDAELGEEPTADGDENEAERLNPTNDDQPGENSATSGHGGCPVPEPPPKAVTPPKPRKRRRRESNDTYAEADLLRKQIAKAKAEGRFGSLPPKVQSSFSEKTNVVTPSREKMARLSVAQDASLDSEDKLIRTEMIDSYFKTQKELRSKMEKEASEALSHPPPPSPSVLPVELPPPRSRGRPRKRPIPPHPNTPIATNGEERAGEDELDGEGGHKHTKALREKEPSNVLPSKPPLGEKSERESRAWASELDILARLPPIDASTLENFKNFDGFWRSEEEPLGGEGKMSIYNPNVQHPSAPLENKSSILLGNMNAVEPNTGTIPFTPVPTSLFSTTIVRKRPRVKKEKTKSLIDWGDSDSEEEEEEEVEELLQPESLYQSLDPTSPLEPEVVAEEKPNIVEQIAISWKSPVTLMEIDQVEEEKEEEKVIVEVPPEAVDRLHEEHIEGLNGNYDMDGVFREWHEMVRVSEELHIFPYTVIDF